MLLQIMHFPRDTSEDDVYNLNIQKCIKDMKEQ